MATIKDVARRAGVSTATASYVLNRKNRVSAQCECRVRRAIQDLRYTPSSTARKLKRARSSVIGFVADNISNRFPACLVHGLATAAAAEGYNVLISSGWRHGSWPHDHSLPEGRNGAAGVRGLPVAARFPTSLRPA